MSENTDRLSKALADRYRIERRLGEGGMATVYLAEDLKHDRKVAVKVLRPELAAVLGAERFIQEIKTTANLQHPHILPLFDSGEADSFLYYVMPYIDGETLRDKLDRETQLGIDEAIKITTEVADALDYAHRHNVIHRDIKPENILLHDGRPMVADFGIALAVSAAAGGRMTETGLSLGTPHYMSPEQATAEKNLSNRSDIYSLGAVLYETLTGNPPHVGSTAQQIIMKIVTEEPSPVTKARRSVPPNVEAAVTKALEKLAADRFGTAAKFAEALNDPSFTLPSTVPTTGSESAVRAGAAVTTWKRLAVVMTAASVVLLAGFLWALGQRQVALTTYDVGLPAANPLVFGLRRAFSVSPDGEFVVYTSITDSVPQLWYRSLRGEESRPIRGTEGAFLSPVLSPDGAQVAFVTGTETTSEVRTAPVAGGESRVIAALATANLVEWLPNGQILAEVDDGLTLRWLDPSGGEIRSASTRYCVTPYLDRESGLVFCGGGGSKYGRVIDPADTTFFRLLRHPAEPGLEGPGPPARGTNFEVIDGEYLVYLSLQGNVRATTIDLETLDVGRSVTLVSGVHYESYSGAADFDITPDGALIYASSPPSNVGSLVRAVPNGETRVLPLSPTAFLRWDLSPDGRRLAAAVEGIEGQELHVYDLDTGSRQSWLEGAFIGSPRWSPDGTRILVSIQPSPESPAAALVLGSPTASAAPDTIAALALSIGSYFADSLVLADHGGGGPGVGIRLDLRTTPVTVDTISDQVFAPTLSPDGRWFAYGSSGGLMIEPWPERDRRYRRQATLGDGQWISTNELVSWDLDGQWFRIRVDKAADPPVGDPELWLVDSEFTDTPGASHVATPEGGIIYMRGSGLEVAHYLRVVPGWVDEMKRAVDDANR